jgi:hypothetical protein
VNVRVSSLVIAVFGLALAMVLISGCAGTARGSKSSVFSDYQAVDVIDYSLSKADALVIIRYPAIIHVDAEESYFHAFSINAIGGEVPPAERTKKVVTRIAQSVIAKSNYYVMSLYRELQKELPEYTVLLSPHIILWDKERGVYSRPILATEQIPSVLTVDFSVYSYPDTTALMDSPPVTFGDLVTPLFVVQGDRWLQPATNGLLLASDPLLQTSWGLSKQQAVSEIGSKLNNTTNNVLRPLDFIAFLNGQGKKNREVPLKSVGNARLQLMAVEDYPVEKIRMDGVLLATLSENYSVDPFAESFVKGAASRVKQVLNEVNHDRATFFARQNALARFDPELAVAFLARSGGESVRSRLQLAEALIEAERKFIAAQSLSIYEGTYQGDYGDKMRQMIEGEYLLLEDRRSAARKANVTTAVAALAMIGAIYAATATGAVGGFAMQSFSGILVLGSLWAMSSTLETRAESAQMSEHFLALIAPALERQISVQMEWLESKERISAMGFAEFRNKTLSLYQARVRSLEQRFDDNCVFNHPDFSVSGRWYGSCLNGLANDRGYGVILDDSGNSLEYLGAAKSGSPSGIGGMIERDTKKTGAFYYEGMFNQGLPNGVVRVEEPGGRARVREFRAGKDVGSGSAGQLQSLTF